MQKGLSFLIGLTILWLIFWLGFIAWWQLMSALFKDGQYFWAVLVAYLLPGIYTLSAFIASKLKINYLKLLHFYSFFLLSLVFFLILKTIGGEIVFDSGAYLGMALIAGVMALMQYPKAGLNNYQVYKTPLFIGGVIFMPLFIAIAAYGLTVTKPILHMLHELEELGTLSHEQFFAKATQELIIPSYILLAILAGFWLSAAWLASRKTQGFYVPGLEIRPMMAFRPDFILPGGVNFVKGTLLTGMGLILMIHIHPTLPQWNWWGFVLAFFGIMILIPLRGIYKMLLRRERLLGIKFNGPHLARQKISWFKESLIFIGLLILLYGFLNAFKGTVPFTDLVPKAKDWPGIIPLIISFLILVPIRGYYKLRLKEGIESNWQLFLKQFLLWLGIIAMVLSFATFLKEKIHVAPGTLNFATNSLDFKIGLIIFILGALLILLFRPRALKNEFEATIRTMPGLIADAPERIRRWVIKNRIDKLTVCSETQRDRHVLLMIEGLNYLPEEKKKAIIQTQLDVLSSECNPEQRRTMMSSMDKAMFGRK